MLGAQETNDNIGRILDRPSDPRPALLFVLKLTPAGLSCVVRCNFDSGYPCYGVWYCGRRHGSQSKRRTVNPVSCSSFFGASCIARDLSTGFRGRVAYAALLMDNSNEHVDAQLNTCGLSERNEEKEKEISLHKPLLCTCI